MLLKIDFSFDAGMFRTQLIGIVIIGGKFPTFATVSDDVSIHLMTIGLAGSTLYV